MLLWGKAWFRRLSQHFRASPIFRLRESTVCTSSQWLVAMSSDFGCRDDSFVEDPRSCACKELTLGQDFLFSCTSSGAMIDHQQDRSSVGHRWVCQYVIQVISLGVPVKMFCSLLAVFVQRWPFLEVTGWEMCASHYAMCNDIASFYGLHQISHGGLPGWSTLLNSHDWAKAQVIRTKNNGSHQIKRSRSSMNLDRALHLPLVWNPL